MSNGNNGPFPKGKDKLIADQLGGVFFEKAVPGFRKADPLYREAALDFNGYTARFGVDITVRLSPVRGEGFTKEEALSNLFERAEEWPFNKPGDDPSRMYTIKREKGKILCHDAKTGSKLDI
jgi:hypothetical protein